MKKFVAIILSLIMILSMTACGGNSDAQKWPKKGSSIGGDHSVLERVFPAQRGIGQFGIAVIDPGVSLHIVLDLSNHFIAAHIDR